MIASGSDGERFSFGAISSGVCGGGGALGVIRYLLGVEVVLGVGFGVRCNGEERGYGLVSYLHSG